MDDDSTSGNNRTAQHLKDDLLRGIEAVKQAKGHPRLLVLVTHGMIELIVNLLVEAACRHAKKIVNNRRDFGHSAKLLILHEKGVLSDHHYQLLDWFRRLRNDAAHEPFFELTANRLDALSTPEHREPTNFDHVCKIILLDLFFQHDTLIGHALLPSAYIKEEKQVLMKAVPAPKYAIPLKIDPETIATRA
jgi:hypothetical protein